MTQQLNGRSDHTLVDQVYGEILHVIRQKGLIAAQQLNVSRLAEQFGVSRTPVTMALMRLRGEGLISHDGDRGWVIQPLTLDRLQNIFELKEVLDPLVARRAAELANSEQLMALWSAIDELRTATDSDDPQEWLSADRRFHEVLYAIVDNGLLERTLTQCSDQLRSLGTVYLVIQDRMVKAFQYHQNLAESIAAGDCDRAHTLALKDVQQLKASMSDVMRDVLAPIAGPNL